MTLTSENSEIFAAVDLGSNSFHMIVARHGDSELKVLDRLREVVRLASGFSKKDGLNPDSERRALECLERFGQRLESLKAGQVRAVGTNTFRRAANDESFFAKAEAALGHPIQVVSGQEEARLIYQGVMHSISKVEQRHLVIDIGGGSTELILGEGLQPEELFSLHMGCVGFTDAFFADGRITKARFSEARLAALRELEPIAKPLRRLGWDAAHGASGTIKAATKALNALGHDVVTYDGLKLLAKQALKADHSSRLNVTGVSKERAKVFLGGLAILMSIFKILPIESMHRCSGTLKDGVLFDLIGRFSHQDPRERSIQALEKRYHVDRSQADRVANTALYMLRQLQTDWDLPVGESERLLQWSALTHEIGLALSHSHYQQHSAYLLKYSDLPGFSTREQDLLSRIVCHHRRKMPAPEGRLSKDDRLVFKLTVLLRMAVLLHRSRSRKPLPEFGVSAGKKRLKFSFPSVWLDANPLTRADLDYELSFWSEIDFDLQFKEVTSSTSPA